MPVGDAHLADPFGWPLCGASGPLRGYNATSPRCSDCEALDGRRHLAPQMLSPAGPKSRVKTFWCERSDRARQSLRCYTYGAAKDKPRTEKICYVAEGGYQAGHNAEAAIGEVDFPLDNGLNGDATQPFDAADPRWPTKCARCDYVFTDDDRRVHHIERLYRRVDTGELVAHDDMPAGASYDEVAYHDWYVGDDGVSLMVVLPDGTHWHVDSQASNCTRKGDKTHKCWVRSGDPRACSVTAGKGGTNTCDAGGGSIQSPGYHGFLRGGWLEEC